VNTQPIDSETIRNWTIQGGKVVRLRPVAPKDAGRLAAFARGLSFGTRYFRFGRGDVRFSEEQVARLCDPDQAAYRHFIAVTDENGAEILIGSARFYIQPDRESCEMAIVVADAWQGSRVAHRLMIALIQSARDCGLKRAHVKVLATNTRMLKLAQRHGFAVTSGTDQAAIKTLSLLLDETNHARAGTEA
jgi:RimJ/RimL family protein N-acetyltransferase